MFEQIINRCIINLITNQRDTIARVCCSSLTNIKVVLIPVIDMNGAEIVVDTPYRIKGDWDKDNPIDGVYKLVKIVFDKVSTLTRPHYLIRFDEITPLEASELIQRYHDDEEHK